MSITPGAPSRVTTQRVGVVAQNSMQIPRKSGSVLGATQHQGEIASKNDNKFNKNNGFVVFQDRLTTVIKTLLLMP